MIPLAIGLGLLGMFAMRRAHRFCHSNGFGAYGGYGWHGPWGHPGHGPRGPGRRGRRWLLRGLFARIDAMPAQERAISEELDKLEDRVRGAKSHLSEARGDFAAVLRASAVDDAALGAVMGRVDTATGEVRAAAIEALRAIHGILDDKQRAELADLLERQARGAWGSRSGRGPYR